MKQNKYDDIIFFGKYSKMNRSIKGLAGAGEWETLQKLLPEFKGKRVLDLGCGFGWHCQYAIEKGAKAVTGVDISEKMLTVAKQKTDHRICYIKMPIEDISFIENSFDIVVSSLAFHYIESFEQIVEKVSVCLVKGGNFIFSVEHPIFTAYGSQDWYYDDKGNILHFPVDNYFFEGPRDADFLGEKVIKYHKTLTTYLNGLIQGGFEITGVVEPQPSEHLLRTVDGMRDELRRPMMFIISARKK
ncbi:malonyl-[acyl-carrier protein] O-methyltransferase [Oxobacter pfennigii]|uniref:Malonyl-[acyl-carrier protein] O-methyltransferase n=1 Tax=Oxobacter pfennigii TaxID=36849 RepID=A0A0P8Y9M1_9CLOT|nr:class I SAM-dependent methyltransferase [Oxobacter pfennigii]KPU43563.1 malonyl-[acyl-carrier protein] O-methyltransferase [Oxobacter pfennigii]